MNLPELKDKMLSVSDGHTASLQKRWEEIKKTAEGDMLFPPPQKKTYKPLQQGLNLVEAQPNFNTFVNTSELDFVTSATPELSMEEFNVFKSVLFKDQEEVVEILVESGLTQVKMDRIYLIFWLNLIRWGLRLFVIDKNL